MMADENRICICVFCNERFPDLEDNKNWMQVWEVNDRSNPSAFHAVKLSASPTGTYAGYAPKPEFRHDCSGRGGMQYIHTSRNFKFVTLEEMLLLQADKNDDE